jgi:formylglycine-generating enzyme required for sulfatase activity
MNRIPAHPRSVPWGIPATLAACLLVISPGYAAERSPDPPVSRKAVRLAIEDLYRQFPHSYPKGPEYLSRLAGLDRSASQGIPEKVLHSDLVALQREALLANPLLDCEGLLLVRRRKHDGMFVNGSARWYPKSGFDDEILRLTSVRPGGQLINVFHPEVPVFAGEMDLHWDAQRLLLTTIGSKNCFHTFELNLATRALRQLTPAEHADIDYYDPCYLPNGNILLTCTSNYQGTPCNRVGNTETLSLMTRQGQIRRLGFDQEFNWFPRVMNDGRVMYARWEYCDLPHTFSGLLFHMNPDGTGQRELYGSGAYWPNRIFYARPIPGHPSKFVGIVKGHHDEGSYGNLVLFDPSKGRRQTDGAVQRIPGYGQVVEPVFADWMNKVAPWARFIHPYPLSEKHFLVSAQLPSTSDGRNYQGKWGIYLVDIFDNIVPICTEPDSNLFEPIPIRQRPTPPVVPEQVDLSRTDALVVLQDIYAGQGLAGVPRGTVKKLRLFTYHFSYRGTGGEWDRVGMDGPWEPKRVLGTVPVEDDGSAYFRVPANAPISVQPLDADGKAIQLMRSWFTAMPGERVSCVGCHETQLTSPAGLGSTVALRRPPSEIVPWYGPVRGFSFVREVQPVLDRYCVGCHAGKPDCDGRPWLDLRDAPAQVQPSEFGPLTLAAKFTPSYRALVPLVRNVSLEPDRAVPIPCEYHADTTLLIQLLRKGHHGVQLDAESWDRLYTWIDLNCPAHGTWHEAVVAVPATEILRQRDRRRELLKQFAVGREEDPEAVPPVPAGKPEPIIPPPERPAEKPICPGWPFDAAEAKRRQSAGGPTKRAVDLGAGVSLEMVFIPAGEFIIGQSDGPSDERPPSRVRIDQPFWMSRFEITNHQYRQFDSSHDSGMERLGFLHYSVERRGAPMNGPNQPAVRLSWQQAMQFCRWLSQKTGEPFTLPTEAQWEYTCRAGTEGSFACELAKPRVYTPQDQHTWAKPPTWTFYSHDIGQGPANAWGLCDMHANVAEWTLSTYRPYPYNDADGRNRPTLDGLKVVRGGSFADRPDRCRSAMRFAYPSWQKVFNVGFRIIVPANRPIRSPSQTPAGKK